MRRGSRGNHFQAPWRWRDVPIQVQCWYKECFLQKEISQIWVAGVSQVHVVFLFQIDGLGIHARNWLSLVDVGWRCCFAPLEKVVADLRKFFYWNCYKWMFLLQLTLNWELLQNTKFHWVWHVYVQSSMPLKHSEANIFKLLITLAAFSTIISIIVWNSRRHGPSEDLHLTKPGFVFPLYHYHRQLPNASNDLEGEMLQGSSATSGRALRQASHPFFELRLVEIDLTTLTCTVWACIHVLITIHSAIWYRYNTNRIANLDIFVLDD